MTWPPYKKVADEAEVWVMLSVRCSFFPPCHLSQMWILKQTRDYFYWLNADWTSLPAKKMLCAVRGGSPSSLVNTGWQIQSVSVCHMGDDTVCVIQTGARTDISHVWAGYQQSTETHDLSISLSVTHTQPPTHTHTQEPAQQYQSSEIIPPHHRLVLNLSV